VLDDGTLLETSGRVYWLVEAIEHINSRRPVDPSEGRRCVVVEEGAKALLIHRDASGRPTGDHDDIRIGPGVYQVNSQRQASLADSQLSAFIAD
jgi:hypothetical protein